MIRKNDKKILITGATGFVGRNLISKIDKDENIIALFVRDRRKAERLFGDALNYIEFDEDKKSYKNKIKEFNPDICLHLASYLTSEQDTDTLKKLLDSNIRFGSFLLDALSGTDVKYFINTGSFSEYYENRDTLDPAYLYSATKIAFRSILDFYRKTQGFKVIEVVPYTIYGPEDIRKKVIHYIIDSLENPRPFKMTEGNQVLDFIYVTDVVDFYLCILRKISGLKKDYAEYHLGTGVGTSVRELANAIEKITNKKANIEWGALSYRPRDVMHAVASVSEIFEDLGWKPKVALKSGLAEMLKEMNKCGVR